MIWSILTLLVIYGLACFLLVSLHESIHFITARLFHLRPVFKINLFLLPVISYKNPGRDAQNLVVALSAPVGLIILGMLINSEIPYFGLAKILCLTNVVNLLPITTDGEVIFLSVYNLIKENKT
ncbi:MAG: hypothetical protein ABF899_00540 [Oenococcus sp.]|uniref:hypothetical protein n=1 Tax=Oenococcus sp. TaxID=1979414 RepID=UPI0039EC95C7